MDELKRWVRRWIPTLDVVLAAELDPAAVGDPKYPSQQAILYVASFTSDGSSASTIVGQLRDAAAVWVLAQPNQVVVSSFPRYPAQPGGSASGVRSCISLTQPGGGEFILVLTDLSRSR